MQCKGLSRVFSDTTAQKHQFWCSAFFTAQLSHLYMTTGKTIALTRRTFVHKVMSLLLNMLSRLVITSFQGVGEGEGEVAQSCPTLCDPMNRSTPGLPVHHQLLEFTHTHVHQVSDAIQPSHPVVPFSSCPQSFPVSGSFPRSQLFALGGQSMEFQL